MELIERFNQILLEHKGWFGQCLGWGGVDFLYRIDVSFWIGNRMESTSITYGLLTGSDLKFDLDLFDVVSDSFLWNSWCLVRARFSLETSLRDSIWILNVVRSLAWCTQRTNRFKHSLQTMKKSNFIG